LVTFSAADGCDCADDDCCADGLLTEQAVNAAATVKQQAVKNIS